MLPNGTILAGYTLLIVLDRTKPALVFSVVRDAASLTLIVFREMVDQFLFVCAVGVLLC